MYRPRSRADALMCRASCPLSIARLSLFQLQLLSWRYYHDDYLREHSDSGAQWVSLLLAHWDSSCVSRAPLAGHPSRPGVVPWHRICTLIAIEEYDAPT